MHVIDMCIIYMYVQVKILSQGDYVGEYLSLSMTLNVSREGKSAGSLGRLFKSFTVLVKKGLAVNLVGIFGDNEAGSMSPGGRCCLTEMLLPVNVNKIEADAIHHDKSAFCPSVGK